MIAPPYMQLRAQDHRADSQANGDGILLGKVVDSGGNPVEDATVHVQRDGSPDSVEVTSGTGGTFAVSNLSPGTYTFTADKDRLHAAATMTALNRGKRSPIILVLMQTNGTQDAKADAGGLTEAMEFADKPSFTVAGVTDWTAAGGHGSDVNLRASEALVNETIRLKSDDAAGTAYVASGRGPAAAHENPAPTAELKRQEDDLKAALLFAPDSFAANRDLALFYLKENRNKEALPLLQACFRIDPANRENEHDLALAQKETGDYAGARSHLQGVLSHGADATTHRLMGEVDEVLGDPMAAVSEFEEAVRLNPSEENYFAWGSELLLHRAILQAREVFARGVKAYPHSVRMLTGSGSALFAGALYDQAALQLCAASDLDPQDTKPYLFMGQIVVAAPNPLPCVTSKLERFSVRYPEDPVANYFYAMSLWKQDGQPIAGPASAKVETLLNRAVTLNGRCSEALLQLGVMSLSRKDYGRAVDFFRKAIEANPNMSEAHYKLGMAYDRLGERDKAKLEFDLHEKIDKQQKEDVERQRRAIKQFRVLGADQPAETKR